MTRATARTGKPGGTDGRACRGIQPARAHPEEASVTGRLHLGRWLRLGEWSEQLVPWLLGQIEPKADGSWHRTHVVEVEPIETRTA
jgi:hypothetical protein